jgi:hypothetical protein
MDTEALLALLKDSIFLVAVFGAFLFYAMVKGRYAIINIIFALYLALLISVEFPYYSTMSGGAVAKIGVFAAFVIAGAILFRRHIPGDDFEAAFQGLGKKIILAALASILVMIFSFHAFPAAELINTGTPIQSLFAPQENFFWWLILPLIFLFFL